jgi:hypothetical protein
MNHNQIDAAHIDKQGFGKIKWRLARVVFSILVGCNLVVSATAADVISPSVTIDATTNHLTDRPAEVKWYPGHYLTLQSHDTREGWSDIAGQTRFVGGQRIYTWRQLEPAEGKYDFSAIEADLAYLHKQNQRLILEVWDTTFQHNENPAPDYLLAGAAYKGGIASAENFRVARAKRWIPAVMDRYLLLVEALGKRFDGDPDFAGFIHTETAVEGKGAGFEDFSPAAYDQQMRRLVVDSRKAFPTTPVILDGNWYPYKGPEGLAALARLALTNGVGWGGPDLCPGNKIWGYDIIRANSRQMPLGLSVQWISYSGRWTVPQLLDFAVKDLKLNFVFWGHFDRRDSGGLSFTEDVIPAVNAYGELLPAQRPTNLLTEHELSSARLPGHSFAPWQNLEHTKAAIDAASAKLKRGEPLAESDRVRIVIYGQSLCSKDNLWAREIVPQQLTAAYGDIFTFIYKARPGWCSGVLVAVYPQDIEPTDADLVIIHDYPYPELKSYADLLFAGCNDKDGLEKWGQRLSDSDKVDKKLSADSFLNNFGKPGIRNMINRRGNRIEVLLLSDHLKDVSKKNLGPAYDAQAYNHSDVIYPAWAKENGLGYLDLRASWKEALMKKFGNATTESRNYFLRDGEHLLPSGERLWAHCVLSYFGINYEYERQ